MIRAAIAAATWFVAALALTALLRGVVQVGAVGGYCASGGPFVPAVECPDGAPARILLGGFGIAAAIIANLALAKGVGPDLMAVGLPTVFGALAAVFLLGAFAPIRVDVLLPGLAFVAIAVGALVLARGNGVLRALVGSRLPDGRAPDLRGRPLYQRNLPAATEVVTLTPGAALGGAALGVVPGAFGVATGLLL